MELKERGTGQDDTRTLSPPLEDYRSVGDFFFFPKLKEAEL